MKLDKPVKHLLVDLDGTLVGNRNVRLSLSFSQKALGVLKKYGGWRKAARALLAINQEFEKPTSRLANNERVVKLFSEHMKLPLEEGRRILKDGVLKIFPGLKKYFYPIPGAKEFLEWAKDHYSLTLATNPVWPEEIIHLRVQWAGLDPKIFSYVTDVTSMHACKPQPEYYQEILDNMKLKAEDCLLIGNEIKMDLPATQVGIRVFIVGKYKTLTHLKHPKGTAPAWRGSYASLKKLLQG